MKNQVTSKVRSFTRSISFPAAIAFVLMANTVSYSANATEKGSVVQTPVEVTYLGKVQSQPVFQIEVDNQKEEELYATLKDESGNIIYAEKFKDKKFSKKFRVSLLEAGDMNVTFTLTSKYEKPQVLQIKNVLTTVEDVVVTKLN